MDNIDMDIARVELKVHSNYTQVRYEVREQDKPLEFIQVSFGNPEVLQAIIDKTEDLRSFLQVKPSSYSKLVEGMPKNSFFYAVIEYKENFSGPEVIEMRFNSDNQRLELHKKFSNKAPAKIREMIINRLYSALIGSNYADLSSIVTALK